MIGTAQPKDTGENNRPQDSLRLRTVFARRPPADSSEVCHARMNAHKMNRAANAAPSDRNGEKDIGRDKV